MVECAVQAFNDCPYCDEYGMCHLQNPMDECDDYYAEFGGLWDE